MYKRQRQYKGTHGLCYGFRLNPNEKRNTFGWSGLPDWVALARFDPDPTDIQNTLIRLSYMQEYYIA